MQIECMSQVNNLTRFLEESEKLGVNQKLAEDSNCMKFKKTYVSET